MYIFKKSSSILQYINVDLRDVEKQSVLSSVYVSFMVSNAHLRLLTSNFFRSNHLQSERLASMYFSTKARNSLDWTFGTVRAPDLEGGILKQPIFILSTVTYFSLATTLIQPEKEVELTFKLQNCKQMLAKSFSPGMAAHNGGGFRAKRIVK